MKFRLGIEKKMLIAVLMVFLMFSLTVSFVIYNISSKKFIQQGGREAFSVASLISSRIDTDAMESLEEPEGNKENYEKILNLTKEMISQTGAKYIYIIGNFNGKYKYFFSNDQETLKIQDLEEDYCNQVARVFKGEKLYLPYIDDSSYGKLITAFVPICDDNGQVKAALGVDYSADSIYNNLQEIIKDIALTGFVMLIISMIIIYFIIRRMMKQLTKVDNKLQELVSSNGDLTQKIEVVCNDEIGDIGNKINDLLEYINTVIKNISLVSNKMEASIEKTKITVKDSVDDLSGVTSSTEETNAMIEETYSNIESITVIIDEMKDLLGHVYIDLESGKELIEGISKRAAEICEDAKAQSGDIKQTSEDLKESVHDKIDKAGKVEKIRELTRKILDIADETSMLALNASIEAARAGESGRGFSVVAEEISKLSEDTTNTAREIQEISDTIISVVEDLSKEAGNMMDYVSEKTVGSYEKLQEVGEEYAESSEKVTKFFENVTQQSGELEGNMSKIVEAIKIIHDASGECAAGAEEVSKLASDLTENLHINEQQAEENEKMMKDLKREVSKFIIK